MAIDTDFLKTWNDHQIDEYLDIETCKIDEWPNMPHLDYNRNEPTDYEVLETLAGAYQPSKGAQGVDFGAGRGRAQIFLAHFWQIPMKGIEYNPEVFEHLTANIDSHNANFPEDKPLLTTEYLLCEDYKVMPEDNLFYFFNPFNIRIFKLVISHLLESFKAFPRTMTLMLYYGMPEYVNFLDQQSPFEKIDRIDMPAVHYDHQERILIYQVKEDAD